MPTVETDNLTIGQGPEEYDWERAFEVLREQLARNGGSVSSTALRREFERNHGIADARPLVVELQFFDPESGRERGLPIPDFRFHYLGRSFYSEEQYNEELKKQQDAATKEAEDASRVAGVAEEEQEPPVSRINRQDEARLVTYVKSTLEEIYSSDANSEDKTFVFDVHSSRKGGGFENVDLIAIHWRPYNICELVCVEVKLEFSPQAVQQALNYTRFSHRSWIAVPVETERNAELRERNPSLFEYVISHGLGVLACRRRQGRRYDVFPVHWPLKNQLDPIEEEAFLERYRDEFEEAGIKEPRERRLPPRLR